MSNYYHIGNGECVKPTQRFGRADHWNTESEAEHQATEEAYFDYLASLPVTHYCDPTEPIGWLWDVMEEYQVQPDNMKWEAVPKESYDEWHTRHPECYRIFLVRKPQQEKETWEQSELEEDRRILEGAKINALIGTWFDDWCKGTKRGGGVLVTSSIQELLKDFYIAACKLRAAELEEARKEVERLKGLLEKYVKLAAAERYYQGGSRSTEDNVIGMTEEAWQQFKTKNNL